MKKRLLATVLLTAISLSACGKSTGNALEEIITSSEKVLGESISDIAASNDTEVVPEEPEKDISEDEPVVSDVFEFNPHVFSDRDVIVWGEDARDAFFNMVDAMRNGEDTFECASEEAYNIATGGRLIDYYFPVADILVNDDYYENCSFENGVGVIPYLDKKEEFLEKEKEFEKMVTDILNENVKTSYSEFEIALSLYVYISRNYTYDFDMRDAMYTTRGDEIATYRAFAERQGICQELSGVYNYLLLQCGVESDVITGADHQWNFVNIRGKDYHIDPTFGLAIAGVCDNRTPLDYFMMTDEDREYYGSFPIDEFGICGLGDESRDKFEFHATDESFSPFRFAYFVEMDTDKNIVTYIDFATEDTREFQYVD